LLWSVQFVLERRLEFTRAAQTARYTGANNRGCLLKELMVSSASNQQFLLAPAQRLQRILPLERGAERAATLKVHKRDRPARRRVFRSAAGVVRGGAFFRIARVAGVKRAVGASHHIDEMHEAILATPVGAVQRQMNG
jgi:hypothetical protein